MGTVGVEIKSPCPLCDAVDGEITILSPLCGPVDVEITILSPLWGTVDVRSLVLCGILWMHVEIKISSPDNRERLNSPFVSVG